MKPDLSRMHRLLDQIQREGSHPTATEADLVRMVMANAAVSEARLSASFAKLPPMYVTLRELEDLPEYSASLPTGTTPGKRWKRHAGSGDLVFLAGGGRPRWMIGQYDPAAKPSDPSINIFWFRPVIRVAAPTRSAA